MAGAAAAAAIEWVFSDPSLTPSGILKALGAFGHHTIEFIIENKTDCDWEIDFYVSHGSNYENGINELPEATAEKIPSTIFSIEGAGAGAAGLLVLKRKKDDWSVAIWASNLAGGTCQYQVYMGDDLNAGSSLVKFMDDKLSRVKATAGFLDKYGSGVHAHAHMTDDDTAQVLLILSDTATGIGPIYPLSGHKHPMCAPAGRKNNSLIYCNGHAHPLVFVFQGDEHACNFRVAGSNLYLNYRDLSGAVKLHDEGELSTTGLWDGLFRIHRAGAGYSIFARDPHQLQYMWLDGDEPYITHKGDPHHSSAQWHLSLPSFD